ncbi:MAG: multiheme c-type cytochrome [Campylobacterota bacterium]|nr:multiheme c-type cytochrome [Campylobacterota bacterium]
MKPIFYIFALSSLLFATAQNANTAACKKCHPLISEEFESSMHKKSSIYDDKIHMAVWDKHPAKAKGDYTCAKCHTPNAKTEQEQHAGITCISCHTIMDVEKHAKSNKNIFTKKPKTFYSAEAGRKNEKVVYKQTSSWLGMNVTTVGSAYHDIDYTNESYYNAQMCMGCHSHKQNSHKFDICTTEEAGAKNTKENCITCHMPKVNGTATTVRLSKQHAYHGFAGAMDNPKMLAKHIDLAMTKTANGFEISVHNKAPHNLMTHPLRVVQLRTTILRDTKETDLKTHSFVKVIGHDGKAAMPWLATEVVKDTMIKADEKRVLSFNETLQSGDKVEVVLGFYVVNPKALKKLNLQDDKELTKFTVLKSQYFNVE